MKYFLGKLYNCDYIYDSLDKSINEESSICISDPVTVAENILSLEDAKNWFNQLIKNETKLFNTEDNLPF